MPRAIFRCSILAGIALLFEMAGAGASWAKCVPQNFPPAVPQDPAARVLAAQDVCPRNVVEFVNALERSGAHMEPTMVNFVGFHNPDPGEFFIFEIVSTAAAPSSGLKIERGDLLFGHFTAPTNSGQLVSNQQGLIIELIAWDPDKQFYNFYELVTDKWIYRGDSKDILDDVQLLHRQRSASEKPFPDRDRMRLRCSGCH